LADQQLNPARSILVPRFTIRTLLAILTVCAIVFVMVGTAYRGQYWAWGVTIGLVSLIVTALVHAAWFGIVWVFARMPASRPLTEVATPTTKAAVDAASAGDTRSLTDPRSA